MEQKINGHFFFGRKYNKMDSINSTNKIYSKIQLKINQEIEEICAIFFTFFFQFLWNGLIYFFCKFLKTWKNFKKIQTFVMLIYLLITSECDFFKIYSNIWKNENICNFIGIISDNFENDSLTKESHSNY